MTSELEVVEVDAGGRGRNVTLRPRREAQEALLLAGLVSGLSVRDAADKANLSKSVAYEVIQRHDFRRALSDGSREAVETAARRAAGYMVMAIDTLAELAQGGQSEGVRRAAASDLLAHTRSFRTDAEVEMRVAELSRELDAILGGGRRGSVQ